MGYTRSEILAECKKAFCDKSAFYKKGFINYRGKTTDTKEYYTEIISEFLCDNINEYVSGIECISRKSSYKTPRRKIVYNPNSNRKEEIIAMQIFTQSKNYGDFDFIGHIEDYQTPLRSSSADDVGKIDLLSCDGKTMRILELKKPDSKETMLRCVLEGFTYMKTADCHKLISDFGYDPSFVVVKASPFVFYDGEQHKEMSCKRPNLRKLMELLDSRPFYIIDDEKYIVVEE